MNTVVVDHLPERYRSMQACILDEFARSPALCTDLDARTEGYDNGLVMLMRKGAAPGQQGSRKDG